MFAVACKGAARVPVKKRGRRRAGKLRPIDVEQKKLFKMEFFPLLFRFNAAAAVALPDVILPQLSYLGGDRGRVAAAGEGGDKRRHCW